MPDLFAHQSRKIFRACSAVTSNINAIPIVPSTSAAASTSRTDAAALKAEKGLFMKSLEQIPGLGKDETSSVRKPEKLIVPGLQTKTSCLQTKSVCKSEMLDKLGL